jgi:hypothetical protein
LKRISIALNGVMIASESRSNFVSTKQKRSWNRKKYGL